MIAPPAVDELTYCSVSLLLKQRAQARLLKRGSRNIHAQQSGWNLSVHKGRGMDFSESRLYQSGDDVRLLDWRVTAKTGKPHTKIFSEERERPVMLMVDLRASMFFATKGCYKSVLAAKIASLLVWKSLLDGDKAGGMIISDSAELQLQKPSRSQSAASRFIHMLAKQTETQHKSSDALPQQSLIDSLKRMSPIVETGTQLIMLSDFRKLDEKAAKQLKILSNKSTLTLMAISDPFEEAIANPSIQLTAFPISDGQGFGRKEGKRTIQLSKAARSKYQRIYQARRVVLEGLARHQNIQLLDFSTDDNATEILSRLSRGLR